MDLTDDERGEESPRYARCQYANTATGRCENNNFGYKYCHYHNLIYKGLTKPQTELEILKSMQTINKEK